MSREIQFYNRYTRKLQNEEIYGEKWLKFIYNNPLGKLALHALVKRKIFSYWYGMRMNQPSSRSEIIRFVEKYQINTADFSEREAPFQTFNEFFARKLNRDARPIAGHPDKVVFPADGRHLVLPDIAKAGAVYVKGQRFDLKKLLSSDELAEQYRKGAMVISRLCPVDYHRFHFPVSGTPTQAHRVSGSLFSVNPIALRQNLSYLWQNERQISALDTNHLGRVLILEVGATCVGKIEQTYTPGQRVTKGAQKGIFHFGGSMVITVFEPGRVRFSDDLLSHSRKGIETFARMGDTLGLVC